MIATTAPLICCIDLMVACRGDSPSSDMIRSTFSITTIASSTTMPIASTMPNKVSWLMLKSSAYRPRKVPSSAIGITRVGISVARKFCRKISITRNTSTIASSRVMTTSSIETCTKVELSYGENQLTPGGNVVSNSAMRSRTALATPRALAPGANWMAKPAAGLPFHQLSKP